MDAITIGFFVAALLFAFAGLWFSREKSSGRVSPVVSVTQTAKSIKSDQPMALIELSNHGASQEAIARNAREAEYAGAYASYCAAREAKVRTVRDKRREAVEAWRSHRFLVALQSGLRALKACGGVWPQKPTLRDAGREERLWSIGQDGECRLAQHLAKSFNADWTLVSGYRNKKGEIDRVLIGPYGIFAFEVKHYSGNIFVRGDDWRQYKCDRRGNTILWDKPIADRGGRSPSQQLNEPADLLQNALQQIVSNVRIVRLVVFTHDRSMLGKVVNQTVDYVSTVNELNMGNVCQNSKMRLTSMQVSAMLRMLSNTHRG